MKKEKYIKELKKFVEMQRNDGFKPDISPLIQLKTLVSLVREYPECPDLGRARVIERVFRNFSSASLPLFFNKFIVGKGQYNVSPSQGFRLWGFHKFIGAL